MIPIQKEQDYQQRKPISSKRNIKKNKIIKPSQPPAPQR